MARIAKKRYFRKKSFIMRKRAGFNTEQINPINLLIGLLVLAAILYGLFKLAQFLFTLLYYAAPVLLLATLIIDINVIKDYFRNIGELMRRSTPLGVGALVLSLVFAPVAVGYLFFKALANQRRKRVRAEQERLELGDLADYEELESKPLQKRETRISNDDLV